MSSGVASHVMTLVRVAAASAAALASVAFTPPAPSPRDGWVTTSDSTRLYYRVIGQGPDTLIAIHGGPGVDLESIAADFVPLAAHHVVIFYDQRGTGRSTLPADTTRLGAEQQIADLDAIRQHFGLARVTLIAHSYGPLLAATYALAHPSAVRRMVFFGPVPPRRGDFWTRFGKTVASRLDSTQQAQMSAANHRLGDASSNARQACRDLWAIALRPRLAEPDRTLPLIRSDLCASDPARHSVRPHGHQSGGDGLLRRLGFALASARAHDPGARRPRRAGCDTHGSGRGVDDIASTRPVAAGAGRCAFPLCGATEDRVARRRALSGRVVAIPDPRCLR